MSAASFPSSFFLLRSSFFSPGGRKPRARTKIEKRK
jgi:hypothetical protein